jgi:hypothetical protein
MLSGGNAHLIGARRGLALTRCAAAVRLPLAELSRTRAEVSATGRRKRRVGVVAELDGHIAQRARVVAEKCVETGFLELCHTTCVYARCTRVNAGGCSAVYSSTSGCSPSSTSVDTCSSRASTTTCSSVGYVFPVSQDE